MTPVNANSTKRTHASAQIAGMRMRRSSRVYLAEREPSFWEHGPPVISAPLPLTCVRKHTQDSLSHT